VSSIVPSLIQPVPFRALTRQKPSWTRAVRLVLVIGLLLGLALLLSACAYPGQDPPCVGANKNAEGCADPVQKIVDDQNSGPWYVSWALDIVRNLLTSVSINSVRLGVSVFWQVFTNLSSTDFAACGAGGSGSPTCSVVSVFTMVNTIAVIFLPVILTYKIFKGYFLGGLIESLHEGFLSFFPKIIIGGFAMYFLAVLFSGGFGISNILFDAIIGGGQSLNDISKNLIGDCPSGNVCGAGIGSVGDVKNIGLLLFMTLICLAASLVFIVLGLVFFLRTIIIFILFAISPLAVVAGLTEEFKPWFGRWLSSVQAMLIAPLPVAICFALVKAFTGAIPSASGDPAGFILQLVYIISFLAIGAILMFKIAGSVGGMAFGLAAAGLGALTQGAVSAALGKDAETTQSSGQVTNSGSASGRKGGHNNQAPGAATSQDNDSSGTADSPASGVVVSSSGGGSPALATAGAEQQQRQLLAALRSLNENMSSTTTQRTVATSTQTGDRRYHLARTAGFNMQNAFIWTGTELGVNAPYFQFPPPNASSRTTSVSNTVIEHKGSKTYSVPQNLLEEGGSTGPVAPALPAPPAQPQVVTGVTPPPAVPASPAVIRTGSPGPASQPLADPAPVQAPPRRLKVNNVIPIPYTQARNTDPFIGSASEQID